MLVSVLIEDAIEMLRTYENRCGNCGVLLQDEDYTSASQNHPYGESYATEMINTGYECHNCGHSEDLK